MDKQDGTAFVSLCDVSLRYGDLNGTVALENVDMKVGKGQFVSVVGPSGCGKSSLMKLVSGLIPPTSGSVSVDGTFVNGPLKIVGMAFQNPSLLPWRNLIRNVLLPFEIVRPHRSLWRRQRDIYMAQARELLAVVGLADFEDRYPWMLSGGMQQRANLCRSLIHEPQLLMLDEPFGALDAFTREEMWGVLQDLWIERRFTCILVTHDLREAVYLSDVIFVMSSRPGKIINVHRVDLPRPRTLQKTFDPEFVTIVQDIRNQIAHERSESMVQRKIGVG